MLKIENRVFDKTIILKMIMILQNITMFFSDIVNAITSLNVVCLILYMVYVFLEKTTIKLYRYLLCWFCYVFIVVLNLMFGGDAHFIVAFIVCNLIMFLQMSLPGCWEFELKIMKVCAWIHLIASLMVYVFPQSLIDDIFEVLLRTNHATNYSWRVLKHVNPGITTQPGLNALFLTILFTIYASEIISSKGKRLVRILIMILSYGMILTTAKRSAIIFSIPSIVIFYYIVRKKSGKSKNISRIIGNFGSAILSVAIMYYLYSNTLVFSAVFEKIDTLTTIDNVSNGRLELWGQALNSFGNNPLFGIGLKKIFSLIGMDVHNTYLQILAETGIIGFVFFILGLIQILKKSVKKVKNVFATTIDGVRRSVVGTGFSLMLFLLLYGFVGNTFIDYIPIMIFCLACVMINGQTERMNLID